MSQTVDVQETAVPAEPKQYTFAALGCCFSGCDFDNIMLCCKGDTELLCCVHEHCCAANMDPFGIGMVTAQDEVCKVGMFCCTCGLKVPVVLCSGASQFLCLVQAQSFPWNKDIIEKPVCAVCFYSFVPEMGCVQPYPHCPALEKIKEFTTPASEVMVR